MLERLAWFIACASIVACPAAEDPRASAKDDAKDQAKVEPSARADPSGEPGPDATASADAIVQVIEPVEGLITSRGFPQHVDFSLANPSAAPIRVVLRGIDHGASTRTPLPVGEIQWWRAAAAEPERLTLDQPLALAPGEVGQLTVYLGAWPQAAIDAGEVDVMAQSYRLIGKFEVDEVTSDVTAIVRRGSRTMPSR